MFDADWAAHGHVDRVVRDAAAWVESRKLPGLTLEVIRIDGRTPVIFFELPATRAGSTDTVLLYGHLDKQPEFTGLAQRPGAVDAEVRKRPVVRPRRRRRRLCGLTRRSARWKRCMRKGCRTRAASA